MRSVGEETETTNCHGWFRLLAGELPPKENTTKIALVYTYCTQPVKGGSHKLNHERWLSWVPRVERKPRLTRSTSPCLCTACLPVVIC